MPSLHELASEILPVKSGLCDRLSARLVLRSGKGTQSRELGKELHCLLKYCVRTSCELNLIMSVNCILSAQAPTRQCSVSLKCFLAVPRKLGHTLMVPIVLRNIGRSSLTLIPISLLPSVFLPQDLK